MRISDWSSDVCSSDLGLAMVTLNRPDQMNATSPAMRELLIEATYRAETDDAVRAVLIRGAGEHFMAGGDLREVRERKEREDGKSVGKGTSGSVRVDPGGRRDINKKNTQIRNWQRT